MFNIQPLHVCNDKIRRVMKEIETFILWHYQYGSKYDTPFWEYAKSLPFNPSDRFDTSDITYGQWEKYSFNIWKEGVE